MATKKKSKRVQTVKRNVAQNAGVSSTTTRAMLEAQLAAIEEKIAALNAESRDQSAEKVQRAEIRAQSKESNGNISDLYTLHSALPSPRLSPVPNLPTPVLESVMAIGSRFLRVAWTPVAAPATGYLVKYSTDAAFVKDVNVATTDASARAITLSGLQSNTIYYVCVKAISDSTNAGDSDFSLVKSARTGIATSDETATHLQGWLGEMQTAFQNTSTLVPQLDSTVLTTVERRRLLGSGVRRYGFADKVSDVAADYPQFWPASANMQDALKARLREIEALRNLLVWLRYVSRTVGDLLLLAGDDAFRMANTYYATVRTASRRHLPEAGQVFQMIDLFWRRPRRPSEEPSIPEVERIARELLHGTREGEIVIENHNDQVAKGKRTVIDKTRKIPKAKRSRRYNSTVQCGENAENGEPGEALSADCDDVADDFLATVR